MLRIGLTGGIGTGKSTASKILKELGAFIFDADKEAKRILLSNEIIKNELISEFGTDIMTVDGNVDNNKLARVAFQDQDHPPLALLAAALTDPLGGSTQFAD